MGRPAAPQTIALQPGVKPLRVQANTGGRTERDVATKIRLLGNVILDNPCDRLRHNTTGTLRGVPVRLRRVTYHT